MSLLIARLLVIFILFSLVISFHIPSKIKHVITGKKAKNKTFPDSKLNHLVLNISTVNECLLPIRKYDFDVGKLLNTPIENERNYVYMPNIEAQLIDFALNDNRIFWLINILVLKRPHKRVQLIDIYDRKFNHDGLTNKFAVQLDGKLSQKYPFTLIVLKSLSFKLENFDFLALENSFVNQISNEFIFEILLDSNLDHRNRLKLIFEARGVKLKSRLKENFKKSPEILDLAIRFFSRSNISKITSFDPTETTLSMCKLFKQKICNNMDSETTTSNFLKNTTELNKLLSKLTMNQIKTLVESFESSIGNEFYQVCLDSFRKTYCDVLDVIWAFARNRTEYFARKINFLLTNNQPGYNLVRIFLVASNNNEISKVEEMYKTIYKISLSDHLDILFAKENIEKENWWKFWTRNDAKKDLFSFTKALKSMLRIDDWCINECKLTQKFDNLAASSSSLPVGDNNKLVNIENILPSKDKLKMFNMARNFLKKTAH